MLRSEGLLKELRVHFFVHALVRVHLPKQGTLHHLRRLARLAIQVELCAQGISRAHVVINGCGNSRHMRRLRDIIAVVSRPNQHVVGQMSNHFVGLFLRPCEALAQQGDVLMVPGISIRQSGAIAESIDLIAVIPPGHDPSILGRLVTQPPIGLAVVIDEDHLTIFGPTFQYDGGLRQALPNHPAVVDKLHATHDKHQEDQHGRGLPLPFRFIVSLQEGYLQFFIDLQQHVTPVLGFRAVLFDAFLLLRNGSFFRVFALPGLCFCS
mmetsp:Transcript_43359/g.94218  ORF Transcript_43359/g.94218 Transcript_43359/m.94218 type:complete len:266 (-) Transcript_43359:435-1232(-)